MKSVLISIRPKWCELIAKGEKTMEVRKTRPKLETPFKVYIYCTSGTGKNTFNVPVSHEQLLRHYAETGSMECLNCPIGNGKVIGEFICDAITPLFNVCTDNWHNLAGDVHEWHKELVKRACLTDAELKSYAKGKNCFAWNISGLKIYDKPKPLESTSVVDNKAVKNCTYRECIFNNPDLTNGALLPGSYLCADKTDWCTACKTKAVTRPPQSWCYVMEE